MRIELIKSSRPLRTPIFSPPGEELGKMLVTHLSGLQNLWVDIYDASMVLEKSVSTMTHDYSIPWLLEFGNIGFLLNVTVVVTPYKNVAQAKELATELSARITSKNSAAKSTGLGGVLRDGLKESDIEEQYELDFDHAYSDDDWRDFCSDDDYSL